MNILGVFFDSGARRTVYDFIKIFDNSINFKKTSVNNNIGSFENRICEIISEGFCDEPVSDGDDLLKLANDWAYFDLGELIVFGED